MNLPYEGYEYYVDDFNTYHFQVVVPYSTYNYRVEVLSPVIPVVEETTVTPDVKLADIKKWVPSLDGVVDDTNSQLYPLFLLLRDIGKDIIVYELCGSSATYIRAVSYYVAHYMMLHIKAIKDQENKMTLSPQTKNEIDTDKEIELSMLSSEFGTYKQTVWGQMFWTVYGHISKFDIGYEIY